jgi:hypothetical protein
VERGEREQQLGPLTLRRTFVDDTRMSQCLNTTEPLGLTYGCRAFVNLRANLLREGCVERGEREQQLGPLTLRRTFVDDTRMSQCLNTTEPLGLTYGCRAFVNLRANLLREGCVERGEREQHLGP